MSDREDYDSDAPEEFTTEQGIQQDEEIRRIQRENKARVIREGKERRRKWAQKITPRPSKAGEKSQAVSESEPQEESNTITAGFLPDSIVQMLAAREKKVFLSDTVEEKDEKKSTTTSKKRKSNNNSGLKPIILSEIGPPPCVDSALEFLKKKKMSVPRSSSVLNNSNQAFRLLSRSGVLLKK